MKIQKQHLLLVCLLLLVLSFPINCFSDTIIASVSNPNTGIGTLANVNDSFSYGPFTIMYAGDPDSYGSPEDIAAGDGLDESWDWSFDYRYNYDPLVFNSNTILTSAVLTLNLTANGSQVSIGNMETVRMLWLDPIDEVLFSTVNEPDTITINLLTYYTSAEIMGRFMSTDYDGQGTIRMRFLDDAVVNFAELSLSSSPVPEPATMILFGIGLIGLAGLSRKQR